MSTPETFTYTKTVTVELKDVDGKPIREGSVLRNVKEGKDRGVVNLVVRPDGKVYRGVIPCWLGDIHIQFTGILCGVTRVTNRYSEWQHIPHDEQTFEERYKSWLIRDYDHDTDRAASKDEGLAIDGIMALLPADVVHWETGPWPDRIEDALGFLSAYLSELKK